MGNTTEYFKRQKTEYLKNQLKFLKKLGITKHKKEINEILKRRLK